MEKWALFVLSIALLFVVAYPATGNNPAMLVDAGIFAIIALVIWLKARKKRRK